MEAPEKIYVSSDPFGFLHAYDCENHPPIVEEYVRKDAFIEKAWDWIEDNILSSNQQDKSRLYFEQFKNYLKGD